MILELTPDGIEGEDGDVFLNKYNDTKNSFEFNIQLVENHLESFLSTTFGRGVYEDSWTGDLVSDGGGLLAEIAPHTSLVDNVLVLADAATWPIPDNDTSWLWELQSNTDAAPQYAVTDSLTDPSTEEVPAHLLASIVTSAGAITGITPLHTLVPMPGAAGGGSGTVASVALDVTDVPWLAVSGSPVTTTGTLTVELATGLTANRFLASPDSVTGEIALRSIVANDLPIVPTSKGGTGVSAFTVASLVGTDAASTSGNLRSITIGSGLDLTGNVLSVSAIAVEVDTIDSVALRGSTTGETLSIGGLAIGLATPETQLHIYGTGTEITTGLLDTNFRLQTQTATANAGSEISFRGHSSAAENVGVYAAISAPVTANDGTGATGYLLISTKASQAATGLVERAKFDSAGLTLSSGKVIAPAGQLTGLLSKAVLGTDASGNIIESTSAGTGTVTSVALAVPGYFTVTGSPITTNGTLTIAATTGQTANSFLATPDGTTGALSLRTLVVGDLPVATVAKGGTGLSSITAARLVGTHNSSTTGNMQAIAIGTGLDLTAGVLSSTVTGSVQDLQDVTDEGATTTDVINVGGVVATGDVTTDGQFTITSPDTDVLVDEVVGRFAVTTDDLSTITNRTVMALDAVSEGTFAGTDQAGTSFSIKLHQNPGIMAEVLRVYASGLVQLPGETSKIIQLARRTASDTAGNTLSILAGSATTLATNKAGGDLRLFSGVSTGNAGSSVTIWTPTPGSSGTGDRSYAVRGTFNSTGLTVVGTTITPSLRLTGLLSAGVLATDGSGNVILSSLPATTPSWDATLVISNTTDEKAIMTRNLANAASDYTFAITGTPDLGTSQTNSQSSALLRLGNALSGASNRGTYLGINMPSGTSSDFFTIQQNGATKLTFTNGAGLVLPVDSGILAIGAGSGGAGPTGTNVNGNMVILDTPSGLTRNWIDLQKNHVSAGYWADDGTAWIKSLIFGTAANHTLNNSGLNLAAGTMIAPAARLTGLTSKAVLGTDSSGNIIESSVSGESWIGEIKMWSPQPGQSVDGTSGSPSADWAVCDGRTVNSITTPDLENLFILGATVLGANLTGGSSTHVHSIDPPNTSSAVSGATVAIDIGGGGPVVTRQISEHDHDVDIAAFDSASAGHTPPYYSLVYVMKVA